MVVRQFLGKIIAKDRHTRTEGLGISVALIGLLTGVATVFAGPLIILLVGGVFATCGLVILSFSYDHGHRVFWNYTVFLLLGYMFLGKSFAYIGFRLLGIPIYLSEIGLAIAVVSALLGFLLTRIRRTTSHPLLITVFMLFLIWQAFCTIPYLVEYPPADVLRDAALWGYAAFTIIIYLLVPRETIECFIGLYGRILPFCLIWLLVAFAFGYINPLDVRLPNSPVTLFWHKTGDVGVHLAGMGAFMLLRLDERGKRWPKAVLWPLWLLWGSVLIAYGSRGRGGLLSSLVGLGMVVFVRPKTRWDRLLLLAILLATLVTVAGFNIAVGGRRFVSTQQLVANVTSIFGQRSVESLEGSKRWRLDWWGTIIDYTFGGEYFWIGKGYGINLADDDGFQVAWDRSLRSPHNSHMTVLARSGVPGFLLWLLFLFGFGWFLAKNVRARSPASNPRYARYALWFLAYWAAFLVNASFDVFLEGPMGGVWFWCLVGMALVYFARRGHIPQQLRRVKTENDSVTD